MLIEVLQNFAYAEKKPDPILTPNQWHDLCAEIGRLVTRDGLFNVREALDTFKVNQKPR
jgi:hypothetical protein